jgi:hypothetical protein
VPSRRRSSQAVGSASAPVAGILIVWASRTCCLFIRICPAMR